jgi:LDH2 family malate/lactate/ureidoglycolate dehydrogenase
MTSCATFLLAPVNDAVTVANNFISANFRGNDTHGVFHVPAYLKRLRAGLNNAHPILVTHIAGIQASTHG